MTRTLLALCAVLALAPRPARAAAGDVSLIDLVDLDYAYTTLTDRALIAPSPQALLDGARTGIVAYLDERGIVDPVVPLLHVRADGRGAVPAMEREVGLALERYGGRVRARDLVDAAIAGEVAALHDPYSVYFTAAELKGFTRALDGSAFGGIGAQLAYDGSAAQWRIESVFPGGPAAAAGLRAADAIAAVDGTPAGGADAGAALVAALRGPAGTVVALGIVRDGVPLADPVSVKRAVVTPPDVSERLLPGGIGYVALHGFPEDAAAQVRGAFERLRTAGARAYVLDLRGNGGGYESAAVRVASLFVPAGPVVANQSRGGPRVAMAATGNALPAAPLAVLVDGDTASGAELVAGALQDRKLALLVGTRTFGKGVAEEMFPLPDGSAIKLTTMRYFTAGGRSIDRVGLVPDAVVAEPAGARRGVPGQDPQLDRALALLAAGAVE